MGFYLVTGAAGFIGSHLTDALIAGGHTVRGLDDFSTGRAENVDPRCRMIRGDIADPAIVRRAMDGVDGCFHLAAIASVVRATEDWLGSHRANQTGTVTILDAARLAGTPVVYASSAAVYGDLAGGVAHEGLRPLPRTAYGADKLGSEMHARAAWLVHGVPTFGMRFFNVYGARQDPASPYSGVISIFSRLMARGQPLRVNGDGRQVRDFIHVSDVMRHLTAAMGRLHDTPGCEVANVCTGAGTSLLQLIGVLRDLHGRQSTVDHTTPRPGDIAHSVGDPAWATKLLGVTASTSLACGLATLSPATTQAA